MYSISAIGQDSHRFASECKPDGRALTLGGIKFPGEAPLCGNSDADAVLHALCNAISGLTGVNVLGEIADVMCKKCGVTDSAAYVIESMKYLEDAKIVHISFSVECARPKLAPRIAEMRENIARISGIGAGDVCITATSGEGLTDFGRGLGVQALCIVTAVKNSSQEI